MTDELDRRMLSATRLRSHPRSDEEVLRVLREWVRRECRRARTEEMMTPTEEGDQRG